MAYLDPTAERTDPEQRVRWTGSVFFTVMWTAVLWQPLSTALSLTDPTDRTVGAAATVVFGFMFALFTIRAARVLRSTGQPPELPWSLGLLASLAAVAGAMAWTIGPDGLSSVVYLGVFAVVSLRQQVAVPVLAGLAAATAGSAVIPGWHFQPGLLFSLFAATAATWALLLSRRRTAQLALAREENLRLAVLDERNRMALDLHDILGHSLTVIRAKAELAERLLEVDQTRARTELQDLERLSREALADVRRAVSGYREVSLPGELARARLALQAAQIEADLPGSTEHVVSELRQLFAWAVRETITNVIRHSSATHVTITLDPARLEVRDDGTGMAPGTPGGTGLNGLRERAADVGARVIIRDADPGFSVTVTRPAEPEHADG